MGYGKDSRRLIQDRIAEEAIAKKQREKEEEEREREEEEREREEEQRKREDEERKNPELKKRRLDYEAELKQQEEYENRIINNRNDINKARKALRQKLLGGGTIKYNLSKKRKTAQKRKKTKHSVNNKKIHTPIKRTRRNSKI